MIKLKIRALWSFVFLICLSAVPCKNLYAQITVTGSNGLNGTYTNLTQVGGLFDILNNSNQQNQFIQIVLDADLLAEDGAIALGAGDWSQLTITASNPISIISNLPGSLITLDGATNVVIDGAVLLGVPSIRIVNSNNSLDACTVQLKNGASNNQIKNCTIIGASQATGTGTVVIGQLDDLQACNNNQLLNCFITAENGNWPQQAIYLTGNASNPNSNILIADCVINNYFAAADSSSGIAINGAINHIQILRNRFFQESAPVIAGDIFHAAIFANSSLILHVVIDSNRIGYENAMEQGFYTITGEGNATIAGIAIATSNAEWNSITRNHIAGWKTTFTQIGGTFNFNAIEVASGKTNVGGTESEGNIIGDTMLANSIDLQSLHGAALVNGILISCSDSSIIKGNSIAGIRLLPNDTATVIFNGIWLSGSNCTIDMQWNHIGAETAPLTVGNQLQYKGAALMKGIYLSGTGAVYAVIHNHIEHLVSFSTANAGTNYLAGIEAHRGIAHLDSNVIHDLIFHGNTQSAFANRGILMRSNGVNNRLIGNLIYNLSAVSDTASNINVIAIHHSTGYCIISGNTSFGLTNKAVGGYVAGIWKTAEFESQIFNNRISLDNATNTNRMQLAGIVDASAAGSMKCWYNAVRLGGNNGGGTGNGYNSLAFQRSSNAMVDVRNNIFVNQRTGYGNHFSIVNTSASNIGWLSDHNVLYTVNSNTLGVWGTSSGGGIRDFTGWQLAALSDLFSVNQMPHFQDIATGQLELKLDSNCSLAGKGIDVSVTVDYSGKTRLSPTDIGPYEFSSNYTVWSGSTTQWNVASNWCGRVPNANLDVYIPEALLVYPILEDGEQAQVKNIIVGQLPTGR